jgi:hypothetical protein
MNHGYERMTRIRRKNSQCRWSSLLGLYLLVLAASALLLHPAAAADVIKIEPREAWSGYFGGQDVDVGFRIANGGGQALRVGWAARIQKQVVARRELTVTGKAGQPAEFTVRLKLPDAEPRVILPAAVVITLDGREVLERPLWIFPRDPFADQRKILSALPIALFDPEKKTTQLLEKLEITVKELRNVEALDEVAGGLILIGEGISFRDYRGLPAAMLAAAARGNRVLCLAPTGGSLELPGANPSEAGDVRSLNFRRADVIAEFDKRLDYRAWPTDGKMIASGITLIGERGPVVADVSKDGNGWPWLEVEYPSSGRFILCGFAIVEKWESGPAPRYVFQHVLERVAGKKSNP